MRSTQTILVVEDDPRIAEVLQVILEDEGYAVLLAGNGHEALATLRTAQPTVILSDILMPGMDGLELCRALQMHPTHHATPIILMRANTQLPTDSCAASFLPKPFQLATVLMTVAHVITHLR
jgi:CheY-like chemotaxis protein